MAEYNDFESLFKALERDIEKSTYRISEQIRDLWKQMVEDNWYGVYESSEYIRSFETLEAISIIEVKNTNGIFSASISYDESKIHPFTYIGKSSGMTRYGHTDVPNQWNIIENGFTMENGVYRRGAKAFEEMLKYVKSDAFVALFNSHMKKLGYDVK